MQWDRFDIIEAYYLYARQYHKGQWSKEYKIFGRIAKLGYTSGYPEFLAALSLRTYDNPSDALSANGVEIYNQLVRKGL